MAPKIEVETQGISDNWLRANNDFTVKSRGLMNADQMFSAMLHLAPLDMPDRDDPCAPHVMTEGPGGSFSFIGQGGTIFCPDTEVEITARQACDMAFGKVVAAAPPPKPSRSSSQVQLVPATTVWPIRKKRKFGWLSGTSLFLSLCSLLGTMVMVFGVSSMRDRGVPSDNVLFATEIGFGLGLAGVLLMVLALKLRRTVFYDANDLRVNADGSALEFVLMAQSFGDSDGGSDDYDGDFDADID